MAVRYRVWVVAFALAAGVAACSDQLLVENDNSPDRDRALARPTDVENLIAVQFRNIHNATIGHNGAAASLTPALLVMGMESFSSNANWGMNVRGPVPRGGIDNNRGNATLNDNFAPFLALHQAARAAALGLSRLDEPGFTFFPASEAQRERARAFAYFVMGAALGNLALVYDSGAVTLPGDDPQANNPLVPYDSLMRAAVVFLDSASRAAVRSASAPGANGFPLPATWINGFPATAPQFVALTHLYRARFLAGVARTPADRAAVDWARVMMHADSAPGATLSVTMANVTGGWFYRPAQMDLYQSWHQAWQFIAGMADTSGAYGAWLATSPGNRQAFVVRTPDTRWPAGTTRAAQNASSGCVSGATCTPPAGQYFRNRLAGNDVTVQDIANSYYDFHRFQSFFLGASNRNGPLPFFPRAEMDLLVAEGAIRTNDFVTAMARINLTRTAHGLPALAGITGLGQPVPGGSACVPRVPTSATGPAACGDIMEALKWEKRMETAFLVWGGWYFDARGWGDLPVNTPLHFPVPYQELDARRSPLYSTTPMAAPGTYGL